MMKHVWSCCSLLLVLAATKRQDDDRTCGSHYGLANLTDMSDASDYQFCWEHQSRTCCSGEDVTRVREKVALAKHKSMGSDEYQLSDQCLAITARA